MFVSAQLDRHFAARHARGRSARVMFTFLLVDDSPTIRKMVRASLAAFSDATFTEAASGLQANDWVVAAGGHLLREGQAVAPVDRENRPVAAQGR